MICNIRITMALPRLTHAYNILSLSLMYNHQNKSLSLLDGILTLDSPTYNTINQLSNLLASL